MLKWLVDDHCCPLRSIRISNGKVKGSSGSYTPILTSKGRSLLGIALGNRNIGIGRYLVVEKRMLLSAEKGLSVETLTQNLDLVLRVLPEEILDEQVLRRHSARPSIGFSDKTESMSDNAEISAIGGAGELDEEARGLAESEVRKQISIPPFCRQMAYCCQLTLAFSPSWNSASSASTTTSTACSLLVGIRSAVSTAAITFRDARSVQWNVLR